MKQASLDIVSILLENEGDDWNEIFVILSSLICASAKALNIDEGEKEKIRKIIMDL